MNSNSIMFQSSCSSSPVMVRQWFNHKSPITDNVQFLFHCATVSHCPNGRADSLEGRVQYNCIQAERKPWQSSTSTPVPLRFHSIRSNVNATSGIRSNLLLATTYCPHSVDESVILHVELLLEVALKVERERNGLWVKNFRADATLKIRSTSEL